MTRLLVFALFLLWSSFAGAEAITIPNTFSAGTNAVASEVNGNFQAVETGVDDNAADIDTLEAAIVAPTTPGLNQAVGDTDYRYDGTSNCYYFDADGDAAHDVAQGEREACIAYGDDIFIDEFASDSSTNGLQEAINHVCTSSATAGYGARIRLRGHSYSFGTSTISIPSNCNGLIIQGAGSDEHNGSILPGTELKTTHTGAGFDFITLAANVRDVHLMDFQITVTNPGASTRVIVAGDGTSKLTIDNVIISAPSIDADGIGIYLDDPIKCLIQNNEIEHLGAAIVHTGTLGAGGCEYSHNRIETQGNTTGVGLLIGQANYACSNVYVSGNIFEGNNIGIKIDTTTAAATSCKVTSIGNHFENSTVGANYEDVRATGANSYVSIGNYYAGGGSGAEDIFHRTTDTDAASTDIFIGDQLYGTITMDAGACAIFGAADWYSGGNLTACARMSVDSSGYYIDVNGDGDFDSGTDMRMADADLIDLADGSLTGSKVGSGIDAANVTTGLLPDARLNSSVALDAELSAYTVGTTAPTDGSTACTEGDMYLDHTANKIYFCVDSATDDWFGVALTDTP